MILIVSSFGATKNYPDKAMMETSLRAFLNSLIRQEDQDWQLFISHHDKAPTEINDRRIHWCSMQCEPTCDLTAIVKKHPARPSDSVEYQEVPYDGKLTDMSRKTYNSVIEAGRWAYQNRIKKFWILRIDSDDLLARDHVGVLHSLEEHGFTAVYNRTCHMFDPQHKEIAVHNYPYSTTCNALLYEFRNDELRPDWYFHCNDHTKFMADIRKNGFRWVERDWTLCILTNTGNSISNRPELDKEKHVSKIPLTKRLVERYGLEALL